jgi:hypothetical protein
MVPTKKCVGEVAMAIEIQNDQGEFVPWEFADESVKFDIEWALMNGEKAIRI